MTASGRAVDGRALPVDPAHHTMGAALLPYLELKVHHLIQERDWNRITVVGQYDRSCVISDLEKTDKAFNWQRPTAEVSGRELIIKCFPGRDYVYHYALVIATYLALSDRWRDQVCFEFPNPDTCDAAAASVSLDTSNSEVVVVGWGVTQLAGPDGWTTASGHAWKQTMIGGVRITFVGFLHSIWGEVAGRIVTRLAQLGARRVLYIGKVGTLEPELDPNTVLATGNSSLLRGRSIAWDDFFGGEAVSDPAVVEGKHVTSPSTLLETRDWLSEHRGYSFVDPEIGQMGAAASRAGVPFGYLHIVSNNLARPRQEDLSNERQPLVLQRRARLLVRAKGIIERRLRRIGG